MGIVSEITRHYTAYVYVEHDPSTGSWAAACPAFDVVTFGDDAMHALHMIREAVGLTLMHCLAHGTDPYPEETDGELWAQLDALLSKSTPIADQKFVDISSARAVIQIVDWRVVGTIVDLPAPMPTPSNNLESPLRFVV